MAESVDAELAEIDRQLSADPQNATLAMKRAAILQRIGESTFLPFYYTIESKIKTAFQKLQCFDRMGVDYNSIKPILFQLVEPYQNDIASGKYSTQIVDDYFKILTSFLANLALPALSFARLANSSGMVMVTHIHPDYFANKYGSQIETDIHVPYSTTFLSGTSERFQFSPLNRLTLNHYDKLVYDLGRRIATTFNRRFFSLVAPADNHLWESAIPSGIRAQDHLASLATSIRGYSRNFRSSCGREAEWCVVCPRSLYYIELSDMYRPYENRNHLNPIELAGQLAGIQVIIDSGFPAGRIVIGAGADESIEYSHAVTSFGQWFSPEVLERTDQSDVEIDISVDVLNPNAFRSMRISIE